MRQRQGFVKIIGRGQLPLMKMAAKMAEVNLDIENMNDGEDNVSVYVRGFLYADKRADEVIRKYASLLDEKHNPCSYAESAIMTTFEEITS